MKTLVVTAQTNFEFPLAEATRKQALELTKEYASFSNNYAELLVINTNNDSMLAHGDIRINLITLRNSFRLLRLMRKFDQVHYIGALGYKALVVGMITTLLAKARLASLTDGGVYSTRNRPFFRAISSNVVLILYQKILIYTEHQKTLLCKPFCYNENKIFLTYPLLPLDMEISSQAIKKTNELESIDILYMGHLSMFKGVDIVLYIFETLAKKLDSVRLVLALNGLAEDEFLREKLEMLKITFPHRVVEKGKVDPLVELSKCSLYIYPVKQHSGTHAFPFSLYESMQCSTPFVSTRLDGFAEYFDDFFLVKCGSMTSYLSKVEEILLMQQDDVHRKLANNHGCIMSKIQSLKAANNG